MKKFAIMFAALLAIGAAACTDQIKKNADAAVENAEQAEKNNGN